MNEVKNKKGLRRVGLLFAGGPAPGANAVISSAAVSFLEAGYEVIGFFHGYSYLQEYHPVTNRLKADSHYRELKLKDVRGMRNAAGIMIGTARANPGKLVHSIEDLNDPKKAAKLHNVYCALTDLQVDALVSIGGDDTLKTANKLYRYQEHLPEEAHHIRVVHLPKTIDNDYSGIDFTFGFFTAVDWMAKEVQNLQADSMANGSYFIVEAMGRKASWLSYGVAIAGEANMVLGVEDIDESLSEIEDQNGVPTKVLSLSKLCDRIIDMMVTREQRHNRNWGTVVLAEGLAEMLPLSYVDGVARDEHGHLSLGRIDLGKLIAMLVADAYQVRYGVKKKVTGVQLGYESRCAPAHAYDVMLGSQLGIGAYRALVEEQKDGYMVSVSGQLDLHYVHFDQLISSDTMLTQIRFVQPGSDFHRLARFLETRTESVTEWGPGVEPVTV